MKTSAVYLIRSTLLFAAGTVAFSCAIRVYCIRTLVWRCQATPHYIPTCVYAHAHACSVANFH